MEAPKGKALKLYRYARKSTRKLAKGANTVVVRRLDGPCVMCRAAADGFYINPTTSVSSPPPHQLATSATISALFRV